MNTLRAKISALLVGAMVLVVLAANGLVFLLHQPPHFEPAQEALAAQIALILDLKAGATPSSRADAGTNAPHRRALVGFYDAPPPGLTLEEPSRHLQESLRRRGVPHKASVIDPQDGRNLMAVIPDGARSWLVIPILHPPPPGNAPQVIATWLLLVALGTTAAVVLAVGRITRPLALIERAIADVGADGELPVLPETGPTEIRSTARIINRLSARLKSAMQSRMRLVAAAGHDFRTPLTRMRLRAEFLSEEEREPWLADLDELDHLADSAIRLVREEASGGDNQVFRLDLLVNEVVAELKALGLHIDAASVEPASVCGAILSLKRALRNLMINAATHGGGGVASLRLEDGAARILIEDRGPGIPEQLLHRACEPFFRIDKTDRTSGPGAGLGLAIAKEIIGRSSGVLTLSNRPEGGLIQEVRLPLANIPVQRHSSAGN